MKNKIKSNEYFASLKDQELIDALHGKIENYYNFIEESGVYDVMRKSYVAYYGGDLNSSTNIFSSSRLNKAGKAGQITKVKINAYRNLVKHAITLATANKTSLTCVSQNTDQKSQAQTILGDSLLDYYLNTNKVAQQIRQAVEYSCLTGEGWLHLPWEPKMGEIYDMDGKDPVYEGDLDVTYHNPLDVVRETTLREPKFPWLMLKKLINRHELAARYPTQSEEILNIGAGEAQYGYEESSSFRFEVTNGITEKDTDYIPLWTFYHNKTEALPEGRVVVFAGDLILFEGALPYASMPLLSVMPDVLHQSPFGYSPFNDLLGPQQAHDNLMSTALSNNLQFGKQFIWSPMGEDLDVSALEGGLKLIKSNTRPEGLQLTKTAPELYTNIQMLDRYLEQLSGISSTIRGNPESNIQSGTAMALMVAQSVQFGSQLEESYSNLLIGTGEMIISHIKSFAKTPRLAFVVGIAKQPYMEQYTSEDIMDIKRVTVQQVSAMSKTISGRVDLAEKVMQMPEDKVAQYMSIINTGQLPPQMQSHDPVMNIKAENERLAKGEQVSVIMTEHHANHIKTHMQLLENPNTKEDPILVEATLEHINDHLVTWRNTDPAILMITGQQPPPPGLPEQAGLDTPAKLPENISPGTTPPTVGESDVSLPGLPGLPPGTDENSQVAYEESNPESIDSNMFD